MIASSGSLYCQIKSGRRNCVLSSYVLVIMESQWVIAGVGRFVGYGMNGKE